MSSGVGVGKGSVGRLVGVGRRVGVAEGNDVGVAVGVGVGVSVAVGVDVGEGVVVGKGVAVSVGEGAGVSVRATVGNDVAVGVGQGVAAWAAIAGRLSGEYETTIRKAPSANATRHPKAAHGISRRHLLAGLACPRSRGETGAGDFADRMGLGGAPAVGVVSLSLD